MIAEDLSKLSYKDINELFYHGKLVETQTVGIKRNLSYDKNGKLENKVFAKDVTAMGNAEGGVILLGIDEKAFEICGIDIVLGNQKIEDWVCNVLNDLVDKTLDYQLHLVSVNDDETKKVVFINIAKGLNKPYYVIIDKKSIAYVRKGTSVFPAKPSDIANMYQTSAKESIGRLFDKGPPLPIFRLAYE